MHRGEAENPIDALRNKRIVFENSDKEYIINILDDVIFFQVNEMEPGNFDAVANLEGELIYQDNSSINNDNTDTPFIQVKDDSDPEQLLSQQQSVSESDTEQDVSQHVLSEQERVRNFKH